MKILLCHNFYQQPGGEDQVFRDERSLLEQHGHEVVTYTKHNDVIEHLPLVRVARDTLWNRDTYREVQSLIRRERPQLMHCTNIFPLISPAAYYAARAENVPVIQSVHNYRLSCANGFFLRDGKPCEDCLGKAVAWPAVLHRCYRGSRAGSAVVAAMQTLHRRLGTWQNQIDRFIALSDFAAQKLIDGGLPAHRIRVKPNFVQPDTGVGTGAGEFAVFVGRLSPEKGINTLLDAWSQLPDPLPLKIIGDGPLASQVATAAQRDPRIQWLGWRPLEEVLSLVGEAAFLLMPSVWYETFGRTIIEAFSKGTPAIVSRLGAMAELITPDRTGRLFEPGNAADLSEQVRQLWRNREERQAMRGECRAEFERHFTAAENYRRLIEIYSEVVTPPATAPREMTHCLHAESGTN